MAKKTLSAQAKELKKPVISSKSSANQSDENGFAIGRQNYKLLLIGFAIIVLGFVLMIGGGSKNPNEFNYDGLFGFQRNTLAPLIVLAGFTFEIYAIMKKPKTKE